MEQLDANQEDLAVAHDHLDNDENISQLDLWVHKSSQEITVNWNNLYDEDKGYYAVSVVKTAPPNSGTSNTSWKYGVFWPTSKYCCSTVTGCTYKITVKFYTHSNDEILAEGTVTATTHFSRSELEKLMRKAQQYRGNDMDKFHFVYKCKPLQFWEDLSSRGDVLEKNVKDYCGHPANPANGKIEGIFFGVTLRDGNLPIDSPFGDVRLDIPAQRILTADIKLYFCDFYCIFKTHYVTVVVCRDGTEADRECQEKNLIPLKLDDNPFLKAVTDPDTNSSLQFSSKASVWVEVFYTENVQVTAMDTCTEITATHNGTSNPNGVPNNKYCDDCNLYPKQRTVYY